MFRSIFGKRGTHERVGLPLIPQETRNEWGHRLFFAGGIYRGLLGLCV
jgi:hypothetical protein